MPRDAHRAGSLLGAVEGRAAERADFFWTDAAAASYGNRWRATIFTLFPDMFPGPLGFSLAGEALARGLWSLEARNIRDHGLGRHRAVDDRPAGGGPGMVMRADVLAASLDAGLSPDDPRPRLLMSPRGRPLTQARVREFAAARARAGLRPLRGHRRAGHRGRGLEEVSIGDYVLAGGEIAAMVVLEAACG